MKTNIEFSVFLCYETAKYNNNMCRKQITTTLGNWGRKTVFETSMTKLSISRTLHDQSEPLLFYMFLNRAL